MRRPAKGLARQRGLVLAFSAALVFSLFPASMFAHAPEGGPLNVPPTGDPEVSPYLQPGRAPLDAGDDPEEELLKQNDAMVTRRTAGDKRLSVSQAGLARDAAHRAGKKLRKTLAAVSPTTFAGSWSEISPNPIVQVTRGSGSFYAVSGRVSALAIRPSNGQKILGGAQGGIWTYDEGTGLWTARTDGQSTLSIGAIAIAPSDDSIVYAGTGEGNLSGDSYFGHGVLKSTDGGIHWTPVGGNTFHGVSISRVVVDRANPNRLWISVLRGRAGSRRQTPPDTSKYGIWESRDGGNSWQLDKVAIDEAHGATDLVQDPRQPNILYASFWGDGIYQSTDHGKRWSRFMAGIPADATFGTGGGTRFALGISHPIAQRAVLYAGFEWTTGTTNHPSRIWKSVDGGAWQLLPAGAAAGTDNVSGYCGSQCFYDNVIGVDPNDSNIVYALGLFNYGTGSGGVFRSTDGGQTWKDLGYDLHPDYHAIAINPTNTSQIMIGSDGGVWTSEHRGGRLADETYKSPDWVNLNGTVVPTTAGVTHRTGLAITQFTSIANVPTVPARVFGGTQDNGTLRKSVASNSWFDVESGDGGQVLVDPTDAAFVYGNYFGISPYRNTDGAGPFFTNSFITGGINLTDRSEFYVPEVMNQGNPNQLFLGTYRLYRTDNAKVEDPAAVHWNTISPDLTSGCTRSAPNGARGCYISAVGVSSGGNGVYAGTLEGWVQFSPDAVTNLNPTWHRVGTSIFPNRPVSDIAVDRSNDRIAYAGFNGFNQATPTAPGHVFKTTNGGASWTNISSNLPDAPVNSLQLDASYPDTLYAGTDVGPFVTFNGGASWQPLGSGFPTVQIWQLNLDPRNRNLRAGTHGRGAWTMHDTATVPALVVSKSDSGVPVGPGKDVSYTIKVANIGNAAATNVSVTDPIPANTTFTSAGEGGTFSSGAVQWTALTIAAGASIDLHFVVTISPSLAPSVHSIVNDGIVVTSAQDIGASGSAHTTPIAPPFAVRVSPSAQTDGAHVGASVTYPLHITNLGYNDDTYTLGATSGAFTATVLDATCTTPAASIAVASGASADICLRVDVPGGAANAATDTATVTVTSTGDPSVSASATATTIAVAVDVLVVDNDHKGSPPLPDVRSYYTTALTDAGQTAFDVWDLETQPVLPLGYMKAHKSIVWFTGASYPGPITIYEPNLASFLDGGGHLFMSGQDILDQGAGETAFVKNYLHIDWDDATQNDKATAHVTGVTGNTVTSGIGTVPLDLAVLNGAQFSDELTLLAPATAAFTDDPSQTDGLTVDTGTYKVVFLAFPFEEFGTAAQKANLMGRIFTFFGP
ncbi:MAG: hypothetical protein ABJC39_02390 [Chloroflexota bacterium]